MPNPSATAAPTPLPETPGATDGRGGRDGETEGRPVGASIALTGPSRETLTIARAHGRRLAKLIHPDGRIEGYDAARTFTLTEAPVRDLADLARVLRDLLSRPDCAVVRGAVRDAARTRGVRRLLHPDPATGDQPTLRDVARPYIALDMEGIPRPASLPAADLVGCARLALATLPSAFSDARCVAQASGGHGIRPDLRLRLWFWGDRPTTGAELARWLRGTPADPSVFGAAQLVYTAAPVMAGGAPDPLPERLVVVPGAPMVKVPAPDRLAPPPRRLGGGAGAVGAPAAVGADTVTDRYVRAALVRAAANILAADRRHPAIVRECAGLARLVQAGRLSEAALRAVIVSAAARAGKEDAGEIEACVAWGLAQACAGGLVGARHGR